MRASNRPGALMDYQSFTRLAYLDLRHKHRETTRLTFTFSPRHILEVYHRDTCDLQTVSGTSFTF